MAAFVDGQEHLLHLAQHNDKVATLENQQMGGYGRGKDIDLEPLVGSMRGLGRRRGVLMSGGMDGMEMCGEGGGDEVPVVTVQGPSPQKRNGKGEERAMEVDVDMLDVEEGRGRLRNAKGACLFIYFISSCFVSPFILFFLTSFSPFSLLVVNYYSHISLSVCVNNTHSQVEFPFFSFILLGRPGGSVSIAR